MLTPDVMGLPLSDAIKSLEDMKIAFLVVDSSLERTRPANSVPRIIRQRMCMDGTTFELTIAYFSPLINEGVSDCWGDAYDDC